MSVLQLENNGENWLSVIETLLWWTMSCRPTARDKMNGMMLMGYTTRGRTLRTRSAKNTTDKKRSWRSMNAAWTKTAGEDRYQQHEVASVCQRGQCGLAWSLAAKG